MSGGACLPLHLELCLCGYAPGISSLRKGSEEEKAQPRG